MHLCKFRNPTSCVTCVSSLPFDFLIPCSRSFQAYLKENRSSGVSNYCTFVASNQATFIPCYFLKVTLCVPSGDERPENRPSHWCVVDPRQRRWKLLLRLRWLPQVCGLSETQHAIHPGEAHQIRCVAPEHLFGGIDAWSAMTKVHILWLLTSVLQVLTAERLFHQ